MQSTQILMQEHRVIERVLNMLDEAAVRLEAGEPVSEEFLNWSLAFLREFADGCHHHKEEDVLFPLLEARGVPREGGPIGCMLNEHVAGRDCVARMTSALARGPEGQHDFAAAAREYIALLRQHIFKEDNVLFAMAGHCLAPEDDRGAVAAFERIEHSQGRCAKHCRYEQEVRQWEEALRGHRRPVGAESG